LKFYHRGIADCIILAHSSFHQDPTYEALNSFTVFSTTWKDDSQTKNPFSMADNLSLFAPHFVATKSNKEIAKQLRQDEALVNAGEDCSWVAWYLPGYDSEQGAAIAAHVAPASDLSHDIKSLIYENLLNKIKRHLRNAGRLEKQYKDLHATNAAKDSLLPSELTTALKVLANLCATSVIQQDTSAEVIISWLKEQLVLPMPSTPPSPPAAVSDATTPSNIPKPPAIPRKRLCYICRFVLTDSYPSHPSLCIPCGAFNHSSSLLSLPPRLSLPTTFAALVTGARVNLGYHTVLRLLRCGARVIATSRYPRDAIARYLKEKDFVQWKGRLRVVGADFRSAADAFALVWEVKSCLEVWRNQDKEEVKLCALINNAAQTLTDSVKKEERAVANEASLTRRIESAGLLLDGEYQARVRGGAVALMLEGAKNGAVPSQILSGTHSSTETDTALHVPHDAAAPDIEPYTKSSWVQTMSEIPYEDVMSAHAVNTFVPLILIRELLPIMGSTKKTPSKSPSKAQAYIINVSSREGIFEDNTDSSAKGGKHVHTNMSKAALNMITETEAATAWQSRRVAINTVDPGYMSAAPELENAYDGVRPIGWEDGAGRVLWPLVVGELEGKAMWGRFLKHYGAVQVEPGAGRG
jgi:NAD(P)-dependent dehydrogenase (short-subunit alcohol dehydrogenase family)